MTWYALTNGETLSTPALLVYPDRIKENIARAITIVGDRNRLRPHAKTHKMLEVARMQVAQGLSQFKCATIAEAEMMAMAGATDILIAYQLVGPRIQQLENLKAQYPKVIFSSLVDCPDGLEVLKRNTASTAIMHVYIDVNAGQNRTGIKVGPEMLDLITFLKVDTKLIWEGFHVYDGHITESDFEFRSEDVDRAFLPLRAMMEQFPYAKLVAGGSPTFGVHALHESRQCSPGTFVFWDFGYQNKYPEYEFQYAAVIATRVISKLDDYTYCLDLGYKHISAEVAAPHIEFLNVGSYMQRGHSEEHLVLRFKNKQELKLGDMLYGIPRHVCPTVALYGSANVVEEGSVVDKWEVLARDLNLS